MNSKDKEDIKLENKSKVRKLSIRYKILIPVNILLITLCAVMGWNGYNSVKSGMVSMGVEKAEVAAAIASFTLDTDLIESLGDGQASYEDYAQILPALNQVRQLCGAAYVYTVYEKGGVLYYGIASDDTAADCGYGSEFEYTYSEFSDVFSGKNYVQDYIEHTDGEDLISAYRPLYNSAGKVIAILGCDYDASAIQQRMNALGRSILMLAVVSIVISLVILYFIINDIMKSLKKVDDKIYDIVNNEGDLTQKLEIRSGDEMEKIADNVNVLLEYIRGIMLNISGNADTLKDSAGTVAENLLSAKDGVTGVSTTMEQMSAAMEETSASLIQVNDNMASIDETIVSIADKAATESRSAGDTVRKVKEIYGKAAADREEAVKKAEQMSQVVNEKIESSKAVSQIDALTEEIINITEQTSLLALNANIEAARAGAAGRGFAVVAAEIGSLATNSAKAAEEIQKVSQEVIEAVNELAGEAEKMIRFMNETAMAGYDKLLENSQDYQSDVTRLNGTLQEFAAESDRLRKRIDNIKGLINVVNTAVEESTNGLISVADVVSDLTGSIEEINREADGNKVVAEQLGEEVGKFKLS